MEFRIMNEKNVSLLGFGGMRFPKTASGEIDREKAVEMVRTAHLGGVNYFDTAYVYHEGKSEGLYKEALSVYPRESYYLADKMPLWEIKSADDCQRIFDEQLERLGTDYIDFYLIHAVNNNALEKVVLPYNVIEFCKEMKRLGKIKHLGFSFHDEKDIFIKVLSLNDWDFCQIQFNYMDTKIQAGEEGLKYAEQLGVPIVVMEPVKGGLLAKLPESIDKHFKDIAPDASTASWALRFVASYNNVKVILSGMSDISQVNDNLKTFSALKPLTEDEKAAIETVRSEIMQGVRVGCTGCSYCMPCPKGVAIPLSFRIWNEYGMYGNIERSGRAWKELASEKKPDNCVACGRCMTLCPQKLEIPSLLKKCLAEMEAIVK